MGAVDYVRRKCLIKSGIYVVIASVIMVLIGVNYDETMLYIKKEGFVSFIMNNGLVGNIVLIKQAFKDSYNNTLLMTCLFSALALLNLSALITLIVNYKRINLPYALGFFTPLKQFNWSQSKKAKNVHDRFVAKKANVMHYKNPVSIDIDKYHKNADKIVQYLGKEDSELEITR